MKTILKRVSAVVLALAVMVTAFVFDVPEKITAEAATVGGCSGHSGMTAWTDTTSLPTTTGKYYLAENVTLTTKKDGSAAIISTGADVTLCLNGKTITAEASSQNTMRIYSVENSSLTLCDCVGTGELTGGCIAGYGGAVLVGSGGNFTMYGGKISGNSSTGGNGVLANGTFKMYGGEISGNTPFGSGTHGGGVFVGSNTNGTFEMYGGTITGNKAYNGCYGGGVYVNKGKFIINGSVVISDNTDSNRSPKKTNVYLKNNSVITIGRDFNTDSKIGVGTDTTPTCTSPVDVTTFADGVSASDISGKFTSENSGQSLVYNSGKVQFTKSHSYQWSKDETSHWQVCSKCGDEKEPAAHTWNAGTVSTGATCTTTGEKTFTCSVCNQTKTETIKATGHKTTKTEAKAATCTENGNKEYWYCSTCKKYFSNSTCTTETTLAATVISKTGHSYSSAWTTDATYHWHACSNGCGTKSGNGTHSFEQKSDGTNHWQECSVCGYTNDKKTHTFTQNHDNTNHWHQCTGCGYTKDTTQHSLTYNADDTCRWQECTGCDYVTGTTDHTFIRKYDETDHWYECETCQYKKSVTTHTLTAKKDESTHWQECGCGYKEGETSHVWSNWALTAEPTVNTTGTAEHTCSCGEKQTKTDVPALTDASVWSKDETTKPTVDTDGEYTYTSDYGTVTVNDVPKLTDPSWIKTETKKPTIDTEGEYTYTSDYGTVTVEVPKLTDTVWTKTETKKPTMDETGEYTYTSDYGTVTETVPELSNTEVWTKDPENSIKPTEEQPGKDIYTSAYGTVEVPLDQLEHTHDWGAWTITADPTETGTGTAERSCTKDSEHKDTMELPALSDSTVWTKDNTQHVYPTEEGTGKDVYTSDYGTVTVTIPTLGHTHNLTYVPEVPATETADGTKEHWHCDGCGKDFADENGETEITDLTMPVIGHTHNLTHVDEVPATETEDGVKEHWHCDGCGKDFLDEDGENEAAADDMKIGKLEREVQSGENAPAATLTTPNEELINAVLTSEDQEVINNGTDIKIILKIEDATDNVPAEDKTAVEAAIDGLTDCILGQYLDVNLLKIINGEQEKIAVTNVPLTITFEIPDGLRGSGRTYSVIRVHEGEAAVLNDMDDDPATVTIETDKFSIYALAYSENANDTPPDENNSDSEGIPSGSGGTSDSDTASPSDDNSSNNESGNDPDNSNTSVDDNNYKPSENNPTDNNHGNPSTGVAVSLLPLAAAITVLTVTVKRKKK